MCLDLVNIPIINPSQIQRGTRVFFRGDFNTPIERGELTDPSRLEASLPTIRALMGAGARILLTSHLGRPEGEHDSKYSHQPNAHWLSKNLEIEGGVSVIPISKMLENPAGVLGKVQDGGVCMLENLRFHKGEKTNDPEFAKALAATADVYVNDAFATAHRDDASLTGVPALLPHYAGFSLMEELKVLVQLRGEGTQRPLTLVVGGAKGDKLEALAEYAPQTDIIMVGGLLAYAFLAAQYRNIGKNKNIPEYTEIARRILSGQKEGNYRVILPIDARVSGIKPEPEDFAYGMCLVDDIPPKFETYDIGLQTSSNWARRITESLGTVLVMGPLGYIEHPDLTVGTEEVFSSVARSTAFSVAAGGDTIAAINKLKLGWAFNHISLGGGAFLHGVSGKPLAAVMALMEPQPK